MAYPVRIQAQTAMGATPADAATAGRAIRGMRRSLQGWLKRRRTMDAYVAGKRKAAGLFRNPGAKPLPPGVAALNLQSDRFAAEQDLANTLYALLVEMGIDGSLLPQPNVAVDPDSAVKLAEVAIAGRLPTESSSPTSAGLWWLVAIPVAGAVLVISQLIASKADVAKEKERLRCVESGACTDTGFWLKFASIGIIGWIAWDKMGLREKLKFGK